MTPTLLLVDDDEIFVTLMAKSLQQLDFQVQTATQYQTALTLYQNNRYERALLDLNIDGDSGIKLMQAILAINPKCEIVILTGYASVANAVEAIKLGAINYLCKPAKATEIVNAFTQTDEKSPTIQPTLEEPSINAMSVKRMEWEHIQRVLHEHNGNISTTAKALNMHRRTLQRKLQKKPVKE